MNTITSVNSQALAMDGQTLHNAFVAPRQGVQKELQFKSRLPQSASDVLQNFEKNREATEASVQELQRLSDIVTGRKLKFNMNEEIDKMVVTVIDASTNEIIREIPSEDVQRIQARMKHAIGVLFDEMI